MTFALSLLLIGSGWATQIRAVGPVVYINGMPVLRFKSSSGHFTAESRADRVAVTLTLAVGRGALWLTKIGSDQVIQVGNQPIVTVTSDDASSYSIPAKELATQWIARFREALHLPDLRLSATVVDMPIGATRTILIQGSKSDHASVSTTSSVVHLVRTDEGVAIQGTSIGGGAVIVNAEGTIKSVNVTVRPWAAEFPQTIHGEVTGVPSNGSTVQGAIATALRTQLIGSTGARFTFSLPDCGPLKVGEDRLYEVPVRATAAGTYPNYGRVKVQVKNVLVAREQDAELWYSNSPEVVTKPMALFSAILRPNVPARLLYHHINGATQPLFIRVQAINLSEEPAKVIVIPGDSKPDRNPVRAGIVAADEYFRAWIVGSGEVLTIPAKSSVPISFRRIGPEETDSGLCGLRLLSGPKELLVRTDSWPIFSLDSDWQAAADSSTPWRKVGFQNLSDLDRSRYEISENIFPDPHRTEDISYSVGGRFGFLRIGQRAIIRQDKGSQLDGNFGVIYNIRASVDNPTSETTDVEVIFEASAGYSGGLFLVNGNFFRTPLMLPKEESRLTVFRLPPGASRRLDITTLPLSGSSYPATLLIRPVQNTDTESVRTNRK